MQTRKSLVITLIFSALLGIFGLSAFFIPSANALSGSDFTANRIIDDGLFYDGDSMTASQIQTFLNAKVPECDSDGSEGPYFDRDGNRWNTRADYGRANGAPPPYTCLKNFKQSYDSRADSGLCDLIPAASNRTAAQIIETVARACNISPKALLVMLQKEQSLVTDEWPWPTQYEKAMGFFCPDDPDNPGWCHPAYAGFFNQVYNAAKQFNDYKLFPEDWNHAVGRTSFVAYQANAPECGGTNLTMQNAATAGLYNYTPYQPNAAALNNLYGTGDSCSAYGNRNFWRMYNDWFGSTKGDFALIKGSSSTVYLADKKAKTKRVIPSTGVMQAWGFDEYVVETLSDAELATYSSVTPSLQRYAKLGTSVYFADGGKRYWVSSPAMMDVWNIESGALASINRTTLYTTTDGGNLSYAVKSSANGTVYAMDEGTIHPYSSANVFRGWEGTASSVTTLSDAYFTSLVAGQSITSLKITNNGQQFIVSSGRKHSLGSSALADMYPGIARSVSDATFNRFALGSPASVTLKDEHGTGVYLLNSSQKHLFTSMDTVAAWSSGSINLTPLNSNALATIPTSAQQATTFLADTGSQLYLVDKTARPIPASLDSAYRASGTPLDVSAAFISMYPAGSSLSGFIKHQNSSAIYLVDAGKRRPITSYPDYRLLNGTRNESLSVIQSAAIEQLPIDIPVTYRVTVGSTEYVFDNGTYRQHPTPYDHSFTGQAGISAISAGTLARFTAGSAITDNLTYAGTSYLGIRGSTYTTNNSAVTQLWTNDSALAISRDLASRLIISGTATRFVKPTNSTTVYLYDGSQLQRIPSINALLVYGYTDSAGAMPVSPSMITAIGTNGNVKLLVSDGTNTWVLDGGRRHGFKDSAQNDYVEGANVSTLDPALISLFPLDSNPHSRVVKGSGSTIYAIDNGQKRPIGSYQTYMNDWAAYGLTGVSDSFLAMLPTGSPL